MIYCISFTLVNFEGEQNVYYDLSMCDFRKNGHSRIYTLSLVVSMVYRFLSLMRACVPNSCLPNSCLCDGWGKYSGILNCHQEASRMRGKFAGLSLHTFCRAALSCYSNTASIDYVCNLVLFFCSHEVFSCFLLAFYFV